MLSRDTRNERKLKAALRAKFALKQRFERIDWEEDTLLPQINDFKSRARAPELPEQTDITIEMDDPKPPKSNARKNKQ